MSTKLQLELRDTRVYSNGEYLFTHPVIQVDQTRLPCESWIQMRKRIDPDLAAAKLEEVRRMAFIVKAVNCHDDLLEALKAAMAFIKSHAADPDITSEMCARYAELTDLNPEAIIARAEAQS